MATTVEEAQVLFSASGIGKVETAASKANSVMSRMSSVAGKAVRSIKGIAGAAMSFRGLVGMAAVGVASKRAADAAGEQIAAERKLESVLAATGGCLPEDVVPPQWRVPFIALISFFWLLILSSITARQESEAEA